MSRVMLKPGQRVPPLRPNWLIECDVCGQPIDNLRMALLRWSSAEDEHPYIHISHKLECDYAISRKYRESCAWMPLTTYVTGDAREAIPRLLWIRQGYPWVPEDQWREVFMRLTVPGYTEARRVMTDAVCRDIGIPHPRSEVARLTPDFCSEVVSMYGGDE